MQIDSAALHIIVKCLINKIIPSQVRQIRQIDNRIMDIELFCPDAKPVHLIFDTYRPVVYLMEKNKKENIYSPSQTFCMTLRKHLEGSRLSSIEQINFDRLLKFNFDRIETAGEIITKSLYAELIPSAPNLILTEKNIIIDASLKGKKMDRFLMNGQPYALPSNSSRMNIMEFTEGELFEIFIFNKEREISLQDYLYTSFQGFSHWLMTELCHRLSIAPSVTLSTLTDEQIHLLSKNTFLMAQDIKNSTELYIHSYHQKSIISPLKLSFAQFIKTVSPLEWLEQEIKNEGDVFSVETKELHKQIRSLLKKEERKIIKINREMEETNKTEQYKLWGTLLSIYAYEKINGRKEITVSNLFETPATDEKIPVNPLYSMAENSQFYFKKYAKMKTRLTIGKEKAEECLMKIKYLNNLSYFCDTVSSKEELNTLKEELKSSGIDKILTKKITGKKENSPSLSSLEIDGFKIFIGKNNIQNEFLTLHKAKKNDLWFHAKAIPGSHVVIETENQIVSEKTIEKIASLAAFHSKGKDSGKVDVDYTPIKYVKKIPGGPPGMVSYTHQHTVVVVPQEYKN